MCVLSYHAISQSQVERLGSHLPEVKHPPSPYVGPSTVNNSYELLACVSDLGRSRRTFVRFKRYYGKYRLPPRSFWSGYTIILQR